MARKFSAIGVAALALSCFGGVLSAQTPASSRDEKPGEESAPLEFTGSPLALPFKCTDDDLEWAGLTCGDAPCPIYVELSHAAGRGKSILLSGNFHSANATLFSLLLRSADSGRTWREPFRRIRGAELDRIQVFDAQMAWVSGQLVQPLPLDPFFLVTSDGGQTWDRVALLDEEGTPGSIVQFEFDSREHGLAVVDRGGGEGRYEVYLTQNGGRDWSLREKADRIHKLNAGRETDWRVRPEPKLFRLEHLEGGTWGPFASFALNAASCRESPRADPVEPVEPQMDTGPKDDAVQEMRLGSGSGKPPKKGKP